MLDFGQFDFGQFDFSQLAEIELAKVEIGRSRNWPKSNRWCLLCFFFLSFFFFFFCFVFLFFFTFFLFFLISLFILFLFCFCFRPQKPQLNPKPRTLHPISGGPFRCITLHPTTLRRTTLRRTTLRRTAQNVALFSLLRHNLHSSFSLLGSLRGILLVLEAPGP